MKIIRLSEATPGLEPGNKSFADSPLTNLGTSPCECNNRKYFFIFQGDDAQTLFKKSFFLQNHGTLAQVLEDFLGKFCGYVPSGGARAVARRSFCCNCRIPKLKDGRFYFTQR